MSAFATAVCEAIEGKEVSKTGLTQQQLSILDADLQTQNFMTSLRMLLSTDDKLSSEVHLRLNKAVALKELMSMPVPVTGD